MERYSLDDIYSEHQQIRNPALHYDYDVILLCASVVVMCCLVNGAQHCVGAPSPTAMLRPFTSHESYHGSLAINNQEAITVPHS